ncbi:hypothetical protein P692DRAFT_201803965 [Suillus brevipes Sb2]|nr:hypothetical protein P692DRAFT_201803965 [Suillus brevipes Sb2]
MVSYNNGSRHVHVQQPRTCPKVIMSKETRAILSANQCLKSRQFKVALDDAWNQIDEATKTIASAHHKSIHHVQNDLWMGHGIVCSRCPKPNAWNAFCWKKNQKCENGNCFLSLLCNKGKGALQQPVHEHKDEYYTLSKEHQKKFGAIALALILT